MRRKSSSATPVFNLWLSFGIGVPVGTLAVALFFALFKSSSISQSLGFLLDLFPVMMFAYIFAGLILAIYALPIMWIATYFRVMSPLTAVVAGLVPGVVAFILYGFSSVYAWLAFTIGLAITAIFSGLLHCTHRAL